ncbi:MAG: hypothetical protein ACUVWZ_16700 [Anaerolineae bacterium]
MKLAVVGIYVWRGKAYLPVQAQFESGVFVDIEPVYVTGISLKELLSSVKKVLAAGHPRLPNPTREEMQQRKDPVLAATKARSWKELARTGAAYTIGWTDKETRVDMSRLDKKGRWEYDPGKVRILPPDTPLEDIIAVILEDIRSRSELWQ